MGKITLIRKLWGVMIIASLAVAGFASAAPTEVDAVIIPPGSDIEIALASWLGWPTYQDHVDAVQMALDDYGLIQGFGVSSNFYDGGCGETEGAAAGTAIIADPMNLGIIGPICSGSTQGMAPILETAQVVMISPANTFQDLWVYGPSVFNRVIVPDPFFEAWDVKVAAQPGVLSWQAEFEMLYGRAPELFAKYFYDATTLLLARIDEVAVLNGGSLEVDRPALAEAVRDTEGYAGVTGDITLNRSGDRIDTQVLWLDHFDGPDMLPEWTWLNENPTDWSLSDPPGSLSIDLESGAFGTHNYNNVPVRSLPPGDYRLVTRMSFDPSENFQFAGLLVYQDDANFLMLGRAYCDVPAPACVGGGIYFDSVVDDTFTGTNYAMTTTVPVTDTYLQVIRAGTVISGFVSADGYRWTFVGAHPVEIVPVQIGLAVVNGDQPVVDRPTAIFDFYLVDTIPYRLYLPVVMK